LGMINDEFDQQEPPLVLLNRRKINHDIKTKGFDSNW